MDDSIPLLLLLQIFLIFLNAVFACTEIAVISFNDNKLAKMAEEGNKKAKRLVSLTSQPAKFLATIQVAITLSGFLGSAFAAENFSDPLVKWLVEIGVPVPEKTLDAVSVVVITLILSYFTLVFGELVPKRLAQRKAESIALGISGMISGVSKIFAPIVWLLTISTNGVLRLMGIDPNENDEEVSEEEIRMMVDVGSEKGTIDEDEKEFIQNVFEFDDIDAEEIITHRTDTDILWMDESGEEWKKTIYETRHSRYPVCGETVDEVIGVLSTKEYFRLEDFSRESILKNAVKPAYFVPAGVKADVLFSNMKKQRERLAIVLDEYGGFLGIVTMNDLIKLLIGEFDEEHPGEAEEPEIRKIDGETWKIYGSASLEEVSDELKVPLPHDEYDTFNGMVTAALGEIPDDGSTFTLEVEGLLVDVTEVADRCIETAFVKVLPKEEEDDD